jgi:glucan phosphoethanolaminetransferase (alkaline phosphatase superfamily)
LFANALAAARRKEKSEMFLASILVLLAIVLLAVMVRLMLTKSSPRKLLKMAATACAMFVVMMFITTMTDLPARAQQVGDQVLLSMKFLKAGVQANGAGVLQVGEVNTISPAIATGDAH